MNITTTTTSLPRGSSRDGVWPCLNTRRSHGVKGVPNATARPDPEVR